MATYKKPNINVSINTVMGSEPFLGDGVAYEALKAHTTAKIKGEESVTLVPFHATVYYGKVVSSSDVEAKDAYCE